MSATDRTRTQPTPSSSKQAPSLSVYNVVGLLGRLKAGYTLMWWSSLDKDESWTGVEPRIHTPNARQGWSAAAYDRLTYVRTRARQSARILEKNVSNLRAAGKEEAQSTRDLISMYRKLSTRAEDEVNHFIPGLFEDVSATRGIESEREGNPHFQPKLTLWEIQASDDSGLFNVEEEFLSDALFFRIQGAAGCWYPRFDRRGAPMDRAESFPALPSDVAASRLELEQQCQSVWDAALATNRGEQVDSAPTHGSA